MLLVSLFNRELPISRESTQIHALFWGGFSLQSRPHKQGKGKKQGKGDEGTGTTNGTGSWLLMAMNGCLGAVQGVLGAYLVPFLAEKLTSTTSDKHKLVSAASLLINFLVPIFVIVYLDSKCWGRFSVAPDAGQEKAGWFRDGN